MAVTAHAIPGERERLIRQGMDDYLAKPIDESMLAQLITDFAHRRHQNHGNQRIDWSLAVRQAAGKLDLAKEMLTMLMASFDEVDPVLEAAFAGQVEDAEVLAQLHRLNGGCAYSGVPGLQRLLSQLEQQLRDGCRSASWSPSCWSCRMRWNRCVGRRPFTSPECRGCSVAPVGSRYQPPLMNRVGPAFSDAGRAR